MKLKRIRPLPPHAARRSGKRGFALIATLTLMMLLAMLATAIMATANSQNRIAMQTVLQAEARQQALVGLDAAIGELQVELGPDQRVTASSGIISESEGGTPQHLLGSWNSFDAPIYGTSSKGKIQSTYQQGRPSHFRRWLISSRDRNATKNMKAAANLCSRKPGQRICLVGEGTLGKTLNARHYIYADLLNMPGTGKNKGCFAWWVGGENQKAKVSIKDPHDTTDTLEVLRRTWDTPGPMVVDNSHLDFLPETIEDPAKLVTLGTLPLMDSSSQAAGAPYFYDVTTTSYTLPINVRTGGLKQDLCLLLNKTTLKGTDFAARHDQDCPLVEGKDVPVGSMNKMPIGSWQNLYAFYNCWPDGSSDVNGNFSARLQGGLANAYTRFGGSVFNDNISYSEDPDNMKAGSGVTYFDSRSFESKGKGGGYARTPVMLAFMNNFGLVTQKIGTSAASASGGKGEDVYRLSLCFAPMFLWWNPYNVPMKVRGQQLWSQSAPYKNTWIETYAVQQSGTWKYGWSRYAMTQTGGNASGGAVAGFGQDYGDYFQPSNGDATGDIVFQPGEVLFFSPGKARSTTDYSKPMQNPWVLGYNPSNVAEYKANFYSMGVGQDPKREGVASRSNIDDEKFYVRLRLGIGDASGIRTDGWWFAPQHPECITVMNGYNGVDNTDGGDTASGKRAHSPQRMLLGWYDPAQMNQTQTVFCDENRNDSFWKADGSQSDPTIPYFVAAVGVVAKSGNRDIDSRIFDTQDYRGKIWQHSSPAFWGSMILKPDDQQRQYHPYQLAALNVGGGLSSSPMDNIGNNGFLGITSDGEQVSFASVLELPVHPPFSLAGFAGMRLQPGWFESGAAGNYKSQGQLRRMQYQAGVPGVGIGNSFADPCLPAGDVYAFHQVNSDGAADQVGTPARMFSDFYDHGLMINDALWDRWFCSSVSDMPTKNGRKAAKSVLTDFLSGKEALPVSRYKKTSTPYDDEAIVARIMAEDGWKHIAQYLMIDGGFNVNSTSVDAWAAVLQGLGKRKLVTNNGGRLGLVESGKSDHQVLFSRFMLSTTDKSVDSMGGYSMMQGGSFRNNSSQNAWSEVRMLEPEGIKRLAEEMVKQVRKRGPFLSMSDFINRRLDNSGGEMALKGALQAAIDATDINRDFDEITVKPQRGNLYSFPEAENGSMYTAAPGYLIQSDVLASLGNILTVRDDTFTVRSYGCVKNAANRILAQAWCEAVVQRTMDYVDPGNGPADVAVRPDGTKGETLTTANQVMGRQFRIVSFKWLDFWDI